MPSAGLIHFYSAYFLEQCQENVVVSMPSAGLIHFYKNKLEYDNQTSIGVNALGGLNSFLQKDIQE